MVRAANSARPGFVLIRQPEREAIFATGEVTAPETPPVHDRCGGPRERLHCLRLGGPRSGGALPRHGHPLLGEPRRHRIRVALRPGAPSWRWRRFAPRRWWLGRIQRRIRRVGRLVVGTDGRSVLADALPSGERLRAVAVDLPAAGRIGWRVARQALRLVRLIRPEGANALLSFGGMVPRHPRCRVIAFVSNPLAYEGPRGIGNAIRRRAIARTARRSHRVYVPSQWMA